jgi:hypothetical protein
MIQQDRIFADMTPQEFRDPIAPKVRGTWNLHNVALEMSLKLEFFTMLSSVSGVAGQLAQSNYAAGNVFQDNFAAYRMGLGLPANTVDLGLIEDTGYMHEHDNLTRRLVSQGWTTINETLLHRILRTSILQQTLQINPASYGQIITGIPYPAVVNSSPIKVHHRFSSLRPAMGDQNSGGSASGDTKLTLLKKVDARKGVERAMVLAAAVDCVNAVLMRSLGASEPLEATRPLASYGIDSLVAVELRNWARSELSIEVTGLEVVGAKTLTSLCEVMLKKLGV